MPKIEILPDVLASQVAAGEVVERPASVVKELVENALDAGAKHVEVEIMKGGSLLMKITDNGCGMSREDVLMSLERHATSKLKSVEGLAEISTMGFRGEAVPSIASVSKLRICSREHDSVEGTEVSVDGGVVRDVRVAGMQAGTIFEVKNLFFNVPARRKFLRTENTESAHVEHQVKLHALAYPEVRFTFKKDGRLVFDVPGTSDRRTRIAALSGGDIGRALVEVPLTEQAGMEVHGYVLPAEFSRKGRRQQFVFLNGRPVEDAAISRAIKDGFKGAVADGLNPTAWLWLSMEPSLVDVNVHPAKKEVRFHRPFEVRNLVLTAVENRCVAQRPSGEPAEGAGMRGVPKIISRMSGEVSRVSGGVPVVQASPQPETQNDGEETRACVRQVVSAVCPQGGEEAQGGEPSREPHFPAAIPEQTELGVEVEVDAPKFRTIGVLQQRYILMEGEDGLVLLDPRAARERIVYERVLAEVADGGVVSQGLLVAEVIDLDARDLDVVMSNVENFEEAGIAVEAFGGGSIQVSSLPALIGVKEPREFIVKMIDELVETQGARRGKQMAFEVFSEMLAKRAGRSQECDVSQVEPLLKSLFKCDLPYCTPVGNPTLIQISMNELEKKFKG